MVKKKVKIWKSNFILLFFLLKVQLHRRTTRKRNEPRTETGRILGCTNPKSIQTISFFLFNLKNLLKIKNNKQIFSF